MFIVLHNEGYGFNEMNKEEKNHKIRSNENRIDDTVFIHDLLVIEENVCVGPRVIFVPGGDTRTFVRSNAEIGAGSVIGPGVEIGFGACIAPGSVVMQAVPPNALIEGNPAVVVGYKRLSSMEGNDGLISPTDKLVTVDNDMLIKGSMIQLGVDEAALYLKKNFKDLRGSLIVGDFLEDLPFIPVRYFMVYDVPSEKLRGEHAHKECHQFLVCVHGKCHALIDNGEYRREVLLDNPQVGLYMPPMIWGTQYKYSKDAHLLVFASHAYNTEDYIRSYKSFLKLKKLT